jgi:NAD(P)-dependent dehydrogenase (short-subunit alcohol dehydrogenase family)/flavodoxin
VAENQRNGRGFVVVTGTSTGIGAATVSRLADLGFHVFAGVRREEEAQVARSVANGTVTPLMIDTTDAATIAAAAKTVEQVVAQRGVAGLVNNAGIAKPAPIEFQPMADFRTQLEVNLFGPVAMIQAFLPLIRRGSGRIVNVGSIGGMLVLPLNGAYSASKFGMRAIRDALRLELRQWNIHVSLIEVAPVKSAIFGKTYAELDKLEGKLGETGYGLYEEQIAAIRKATKKAEGDAEPPLVIASAVAHALTSDQPKTRYLAGHGGRQIKVAAALPDRVRDLALARELRLPKRQWRTSVRRDGMSVQRTPNVLIVCFSLTNQAARVADAMEKALAACGCDVTNAKIEFTDERWVPKLSQFPMKRPIPQIASILAAQIRHKTGEIRIPPEAQAGDYDLVVLASPTWWFQTSMPIRSYLESPEARTVLNGKPFACASISGRYYSINLGQQKKLGEKNGGRWIDKTHFVVAGGQVKSMLSWLGYMKHGEPQQRVLGMRMPPPNLKPDFEQQARSFVNALVDSELHRLVAASAGQTTKAQS